ncbi:MAG TPA: ATP-binding protein [Cyclobacteriaceae bacterium]
MRLSLLISLLFYQSFLYGQQLFVQKYPKEVYLGASQNWAMAQDKNGVIYIANNDGVLIYDGATWDLVPLPNKDFVFSLDVDAHGKIYVGSVNEFGFFQKEISGKYRYHTLMPVLHKQHNKPVGSVKIIKVFEDLVLFNDLENVYLYSNGEIKVFETKSRGFTVMQHQLYLVKEDGLYRYTNSDFVPIDFNKEMQEQGITMRKIAEYTKDRCLFLDDKNKLWIIDPHAPAHHNLKSFADVTWLKDRVVKRMITLDNNIIGIALEDEINFIDEHGKLLYSVSKDIFDEDIVRSGFFYQDKQHNLWVNAGSLISQIITSSPLSFYDKQNDINGIILTLGKKDQHQYVGSNEGVFYKESKMKFSFLPETKGETWNFYNFNQKLYVAHETGVFELEGKKATRIIDHIYVHSLCEMRNQPDRMIMGTYNSGIWLLEKKAGLWQKNKIKGFEEETRFIQEDEAGNIWVSHYNKGIYKIRLNKQMDSVINKTFYDSTRGLPSNINNRIYKLKNGEIVATTVNGIYHYNAISDRWEQHKKFAAALGNGLCIYTFSESPKGDVYFWGAIAKNKETAGILIKQPDNTFKLTLTPFNKIALPTHDLRVDVDAPILMADTNEIWLAYSKKLISFDPTQKTFYDDSLTISIKHIWTKDSLIVSDKHTELKLPYEQNNLRFEFVSSYYENPEKIEYQYKLKGFETEWSGWTTSREATFTNLSIGNFTFLVRARNLYGKISEPVSFSFQIDPPWYRTWWANVIYMIILFLGMRLIVFIKTVRIRNQKSVLEKIVDDKTKELKIRNEEILNRQQEIVEQAKTLEELNATKDRLFSIVSHDLRGPMGQIHEILSLLDRSYMEEAEFKALVPNLKESVRNTANLMDNLLYWAQNQMREGLQLKQVNFDLQYIVYENFLVFKSIAQRKNVELINDVSTTMLVCADKDMIKLVLRNLVNNAIKFTDKGGKVVIDSEVENGYATIIVKDTGTGISDTDIFKILNREKISTYGTSGEKGVGLGLVLCKEFIEMNNGTIKIESELGKGSKFSFRIPLIK